MSLFTTCLASPQWPHRLVIMSLISQFHKSSGWQSLRELSDWQWWAGTLILSTPMWPRPPQCGRMSSWYTPCHALLRHVWPPMLLLVGAVRQRSWQEKPRAFQTGCCCNLRHTNTCHYPHGSVHTQMYLHTSTHMHTHKHLSVPIRESECCNVLKVFCSVWKWFAAFQLFNQNFWTESLVSTDETRMCVEPSSGVMVSGRGLIMLSLHCAHTVLSAGWHEL